MMTVKRTALKKGKIDYECPLSHPQKEQPVSIYSNIS